jgi:two-component system, OmpR family, sensor histidine kinase TctE
MAPVFYTRAFRDTKVRIAAVSRTVLVNRQPVRVLVLVARTRQGQEAIAQSVAQRAAALGLGFFALAALLSLLAAKSTLRPINRLAEAVGRRGPGDLRFVDHPTPVELKPLITALNGFIARLRAGLSRTETFIAEAAHHIRTPLAVVRARAEIAMRQSDSEDTRAALRSVIRAVEESSRSAGQLLAHATVVYRSDRLIDQHVDLVRLVQDLVEAFRPTVDLRDMALTLSVPETPLTVIGDRPLLETALRNILDNAVKYSPDETTVDLSLRQEGDQAVIVIADRGRGLSGEAQARLSRRFVRGENADDVVGSGLGLTIVEEVAAAHGGTFTLVERDGGGTCARLSLPLS